MKLPGMTRLMICWRSLFLYRSTLGLKVAISSVPTRVEDVRICHSRPSATIELDPALAKRLVAGEYRLKATDVPPAVTAAGASWVGTVLSGTLAAALPQEARAIAAAGRRRVRRMAYG